MSQHTSSRARRRRGARHSTRQRLAGNRAGNRAGFTLVELVVALLILTVGLLALVGTSLTVTRQLSMSVRRTQAANIAETRFETMRSRNFRCTAITRGEQRWPRGVYEGWRVGPVTRPARVVPGVDSAVVVTDSIMFTVKQSTPTKIKFQSVIRCRI